MKIKYQSSTKLSGLFKMLSLLTFVFLGFNLPAQARQGQTIRPQLCEGVQDFAVQTLTGNPRSERGSPTYGHRMVFFHNPANNKILSFRCLENAREYTCNSVFSGTVQEYCNAETSGRLQRLRAGGFINSVKNTYSLSRRGAGIFARFFTARSLQRNVRTVMSTEAITACHDLNTALKVLAGQDWQQTATGITEHHRALLLATDLPVVGLPVVSDVVPLMPRNQSHPSLLANSMNNTRAPDTSLHRSILTPNNSEGKGFTVVNSPTSQRNVCAALGAREFKAGSVAAPQAPNRGFSAPRRTRDKDRGGVN